MFNFTKEGNMVLEWMKSLAAFEELLKKEAHALQELLKLEDDKYDALKMVDVAKLMRINSQEEESLEKLNSVEKKRKDLIVSLSKIYHFDSSLSLREIFEIIPEMPELSSSRENLLGLRNTIKNLTGRLQTTMHENSDLIQANLEIINLTLNFAQRNSQRETYGYRMRKESREGIYLVNQLA